MLSGIQPPEGPPVCTALNLRLPWNTAADIVDNLFQGNTHRDFNQTGISDFTDQREYLGPFTAGSTDSGEPFSAVIDNYRDIRPSFYII